ncbi:MAG: hypothetical protein OEY90_07105 [Candidatus Bathyarchaeota archaeon]|nr:hypothetical protein [Candidatus Bathyarchaeota archaeon]
MRKKIIGMSVIIAVLAMLSIQSVVAQMPVVYAWTDKPQYDPGEKGKLKISILNELPNPIEINNITIWYPWRVYDAKKDEWVGNETIKGDTRILATMTSKGTENDHYYREVGFTVPSDGRAVMSGSISINIWTNEGPISGTAGLSVAAPSLPMSLVDLDMWMTSLIAAVVVCIIILAIVVLFATRRTQAPRALIPRAPAPSPPKSKATA